MEAYQPVPMALRYMKIEADAGGQLKLFLQTTMCMTTIKISTLTDEDELNGEDGRRAYQFRLNGEPLIVRSANEEGDFGEISYSKGEWETKYAFFGDDDGISDSEAYDRLVAHIRSKCALGGGRRKSRRRSRKLNRRH
jgi:hypothetical protein